MKKTLNKPLNAKQSKRNAGNLVKCQKQSVTQSVKSGNIQSVNQLVKSASNQSVNQPVKSGNTQSVTQQVKSGHTQSVNQSVKSGSTQSVRTYYGYIYAHMTRGREHLDSGSPSTSDTNLAVQPQKTMTVDF